MTSLRQIEANRDNALKSTGPKTEDGKQQSRRNALRHGFTAETVVEPLESQGEYQAFEAAILMEYLPQTPVEQELVRRLASLFWRLRRATSIETGLLRMQSEILLAFRSSRQRKVETREQEPSSRCGEAGPEPEAPGGNGAEECAPVDRLASPMNLSRDIALSADMRAGSGGRLCRRFLHCKPSSAAIQDDASPRTASVAPTCGGGLYMGAVG
jgi:hypothetical protein